jgi:hypothetical protein
MRKLLLFASMLLGPAAFADTLYFGFTFVDVGSGASAVGQLSIDSTVLGTILADPLDDGFPIADLQSLSITVSGASAGNGTFGLSDFDTFNWWSAGATFDFSQNLVGQPTAANPWGTPDTQSGDFNFFNSSSAAPNGVFFFDLAANGGSADQMQLTSLQTTPEPGAMGLVALAGCAMLAFRRILVRRG